MLDKTTSEIFEEIKNNKKVIDKKGLDIIQKNLMDTLESALSIEQTKLIEKTTFLLKNIKRENELIQYGITNYIFKDDLSDIIKNLNLKNDKHIFLIEMKNFERPIPKDVQEKIKYCKKNKLFDEYFILFTDYTTKNNNIAKSGKNSKPEKDPIIFGAFIQRGKDVLMSERLYYIADWVDEYCDLTLEKLTQIQPNISKEIDVDKNIEKLIELSEIYLSEEQKTQIKEKSNIFSKFKNMFMR